MDSCQAGVKKQNVEQASGHESDRTKKKKN